jgi:hypothetical protein
MMLQEWLRISDLKSAIGAAICIDS